MAECSISLLFFYSRTSEKGSLAHINCRHELARKNPWKCRSDMNLTWCHAKNALSIHCLDLLKANGPTNTHRFREEFRRPFSTWNAVDKPVENQRENISVWQWVEKHAIFIMASTNTTINQLTNQTEFNWIWWNFGAFSSFNRCRFIDWCWMLNSHWLLLSNIHLRPKYPTEWSGSLDCAF